jgi:UDP-glucose 4-epimerase
VVGLDPAPGPDTQIVGSVADRKTVDHAFADHGIEAVVHAGALHKPDIVRVPASAFIDTNVTGTLHLLQAAVAAGHDRFVFTSTTSLMISQAIREEAGTAAIWLDETMGPLAPRNIYGVTTRMSLPWTAHPRSGSTPSSCRPRRPSHALTPKHSSATPLA